MTKKLFAVRIESTVVVVAESQRAAEEWVHNEAARGRMADALEYNQVDCSARPVRTASELPPRWTRLDLVYGSAEDMTVGEALEDAKGRA